MTLIDHGAGIIHPAVLESLAVAGHKSLVLVTDAFYSTRTATGPHASVVHLALTAETPTVTDVVRVLSRAIAIEGVARMLPPDGATNLGVHQEIDHVLPAGQVERTWYQRQEFYDRARSDDLALCLATGDTRRFANVLLRVGVPSV